jgi:TolA-binding protein
MIDDPLPVERRSQMRNALTVFSLLVLLASGLAGCGSGQEESDQKMQASPDTSQQGEAGMTRPEVLNEMDQRLRDLDQRVDSLERRVEQAGDQTRQQMQSTLDDLRQQEHRLQDQYQGLKSASEQQWQQEQADFRTALDKFENSLQSAWNKLES